MIETVVPEVVEPSEALARVEPVADALILQREPALVLAEAKKAAQALMSVMAQKPKKVMMNGEQYIENEDWLTIGHFYGVTAKIESDHFVEFGDVKGWEATAVLVARDGREIGRATAMCLNDEEKWSNRPKKEWAYCLGRDEDCSKHEHSVEDPGSDKLIWVPRPGKKPAPKRARVITGEEKVPMFQLRSMAQTRASSKVHASVLRFVPVLAGFKGTPAEELPDAERVDRTAPTTAILESRDGEGYVVAATPPTGEAAGQAEPDPQGPEGLGLTRAPRVLTDTDLKGLPKEAVYLTRVEPAMSPMRARLTTHLGVSLPISAQPVEATARQACKDMAPVFLDVDPLPEGGQKVKRIRRTTALPF